MSRSETGEFLYRYFRKLTASFQSSLYKAAITGDVEDIHKARVEVKKMNALFILFETIMPGFSGETGSRSLFRDLFLKAGIVREQQLILHFLEKMDDRDPVLHEFSGWLLKRSQIQIRQFLGSVVSFDKHQLKDLTRSIRKNLKQVSKNQIILSLWQTIERNSFRIQYTLAGWNDPEHIHRIRQNIKTMTAVTKQVSQVVTMAWLNQLNSDLTRIEIAIGEWHDRVVLINAMDRFMKTKPYAKGKSHAHFLEIRDQLIVENSATLGKLKPEIKTCVLFIKSMARKRNYLQ